MQAISKLSVLPLYVQARLILTYFDSKIPQVKTCPINLRRQKCNMSQVHSFLGQPDLWHHCRQALHPQKEPRSQQESARESLPSAQHSRIHFFPSLSNSGIPYQVRTVDSNKLCERSHQRFVVLSSCTMGCRCRNSVGHTRPCLHSSCGIN